MDTSAVKFELILFLLTSTLIVCSTGLFVSPVKDIKQQLLHRQEQTFLHFTLKDQVPRIIQHDFVNFPTTTISVTNPVTTPGTVTVPPDTSTPAIVTVPSANPAPVTPTPSSTPVTVSPTTPTTNPVSTPGTNNPGGQPVTNPVTTPAVAPPAATNAPAAPGHSWCVAKAGAPEKSLQAALDYACGIGKADCSAIQQGASCYNPNTLQNHASFAFNSYYQRNPVATSCDFGATAMITSANPSSGSCIFTTLSSSSSPTTATPITTPPNTPTTTPTTPPLTPTTATPITTPPNTPTTTPTTPPLTPTTSSSGAAPTGSSGSPPTVLNANNPGLGGDSTGFGESPPAANMTSSISLSSHLQHFISSILVVTSIGIVLDI